MIKIFVSHNPFLNETLLTIDGSPVADGTRLAERLSAPMRRWVGEFFEMLGEQLNWPVLIEVAFVGVSGDFEDLQQAAALCQTCHSMSITLSHQSIAPAIERLVGLQLLFEEGLKGPLSALQGDDFQQRFQQEMEPNYEVNVIATMSSGKSTLINSLLGQQLLPSKNKACTATITRIHDRRGMRGFEGVCLDAEGHVLGPREVVDQKLLLRWNDSARVHQMELFGEIPNVALYAHANLVLVDTPGPNSSRNKGHGAVTRGAIKDKALPLVLYVLNADQLGTDDDQSLLSIVCTEMRKGGKQARDRFVFVLNRIDAVDREQQSIEETMEEARAHLADNDIHDAVILPVSAWLAKLIRQQRAGYALTEMETESLPVLSSRFVRNPELQMLQYMNVSATVRQQAEALIRHALIHEDKGALAEWYSGVPVVELVINEYLDKYALPERIYRTQKLFDVTLQQAEEEARAFEELKHRTQAELQELQAELQRIQASIKSGNRARKLKSQLLAEPFNMPAKAGSFLDEGKRHFDQQCLELINQLKAGSDKKSQAEQLVRTARSKAENMLEELADRFEQALELAQQADIERLGAAFQSYIDELFSCENSLIRLPSMNGFKSVALSLPSIDRLIEKHTKEECVGHTKVSTTVWYKPWTWFDDDVKVPLYRTRTNIVALAKEFNKELAKISDGLLKSATQAIAKQSQVICVDYIEAMDVRIGEELPRLIREAEVAAGSRQIREQRIAEAERNLEWIANFKGKLAGILGQ